VTTDFFHNLMKKTGQPISFEPTLTSLPDQLDSDASSSWTAQQIEKLSRVLNDEVLGGMARRISRAEERMTAFTMDNDSEFRKALDDIESLKEALENTHEMFEREAKRLSASNLGQIAENARRVDRRLTEVERQVLRLQLTPRAEDELPTSREWKEMGGQIARMGARLAAYGVPDHGSFKASRPVRPKNPYEAMSMEELDAEMKSPEYRNPVDVNSAVEEALDRAEARLREWMSRSLNPATVDAAARAMRDGD